VFAAPKSIQATVTLLENLHIILEKTPPEDVRTEVLPMLFNAFESSTLQVQVSPFSFSFLLISWAPLSGGNSSRATGWNYTRALFACK
jgi:hypothetical protein